VPDVSQGSVATRLRSGGITLLHLLQPGLAAKEFCTAFSEVKARVQSAWSFYDSRWPFFSANLHLFTERGTLALVAPPVDDSFAVQIKQPDCNFGSIEPSTTQ